MKLKITLRWLLFATFVVASVVFESQFAMCAEFSDLASLTVVQKQYWVHWANIYWVSPFLQRPWLFRFLCGTFAGTCGIDVLDLFPSVDAVCLSL